MKLYICLVLTLVVCSADPVCYYACFNACTNVTMPVASANVCSNFCQLVCNRTSKLQSPPQVDACELKCISSPNTNDCLRACEHQATSK